MRYTHAEPIIVGQATMMGCLSNSIHAMRVSEITVRLDLTQNTLDVVSSCVFYAAAFR